MSQFDEEENAAHLQFGDEFFASKIQTLSNEEIFCLLKQQEGIVNTEAFDQTKGYIEKLVTTTIAEDANILAVEIRKQLESLQLRKRGVGEESRAPLHHFEVACLSNLVRDEDYEIEEVLSWIPSLSRFEDEDVLTAITVVKEAKERIGVKM